MKTLKLSCLGMLLLSIVSFSACNKDWLNAKPNDALVIPSTPADYQALLDNTMQMNSNYPALYMLGDGDFYLTDSIYTALDPEERGAYIWAPTQDFYGGEQCYDWQDSYTTILNANVVLDGLPALSINAGSLAAFNNVKGSALFFRSLCLYALSQEFCKPYNSSSANTDLGLPLRISSNVNLVVNRASVQQTYDQIINDLSAALPMLPAMPLYPTRPSKSAAYGLLARIYLIQQDYGKAFLYADSSLQINNTLIDFNTLASSANYPITRFNNEVIFHYLLGNYEAFESGLLQVDSTLYQSYAANDLRKTIYFQSEMGGYSFKGSYNGNRSFFGGLATDEMYLTRAECNARAGNTNAAMADLNALLKTRWLTGTYTAMTATSADQALSLILVERRKELCFRGLRWSDLRRLNIDPRFQMTLTRIVTGQTYVLPPNSSKYVLPLDDYEIQFGGLTQNPR